MCLAFVCGLTAACLQLTGFGLAAEFVHLTGFAWETVFVQLTGFVQKTGSGLATEFVGLSGLTGSVLETESDCVFVQEASGPGITRWFEEAFASGGPTNEA